MWSNIKLYNISHPVVHVTLATDCGVWCKRESRVEKQLGIIFDQFASLSHQRRSETIFESKIQVNEYRKTNSYE